MEVSVKDSNFLKENNARHMWHPMGPPSASLATPPMIITDGDGVYITDIDGMRVVDAVGGLWNVNLGYSCDPIKQAMAAQMEALPYYSIFRGTTNDKAIELSWMLREFFAPERLTRAFFTSGGSDSVETALKLARQYHRLCGEAGRVKFISLLQGYHGTHIGGASVNGSGRFRQAYEPLMPGCTQIPGPYLYRNPFDVASPKVLATKVAESLERAIAFEGAQNIAAFIMEPVQGAGGVIPPHPTLMPQIRKICDKHGILLIADEVITAFGRTGSPNGSRHYGVAPDLMCTAKAITNGYFPFGAVMIADHIAQTFEDAGSDGGVYTGYTYSGHPVGAAAAIATLNETNRIKPWENAALRGDELITGLRSLAQTYDLIGDVRGEGLMCAIELVSSRSCKTPAAAKTMDAFQRAAYEAGAMIRVSGPNAIFSPPLVITASEVSQILEATEAGLRAATH